MARSMTEDELISYYEDLVMLDRWTKDEALEEIDQKRDSGVLSVDNERLKDAVAHDLRRYGLIIGIVETPRGQAVKISGLKQNLTFRHDRRS